MSLINFLHFSYILIKLFRTYAEVDHQSNTLDKLAQTPEDVNNEHPSLVVPPVENGSA